MALNPNLLAVLRPIYDATIAGGHVFLNPSAPMVRLLTKDGFLEGNSALADPADGKKIAFRSTALAAGEFSAPASDAAAAQAEGQEAAAPVPSTIHRGRGRPAGTRPKPPLVVARTVGFRIAALPEDIERASRAPRTEKYGFGDLLPPAPEGFDSFFIQATETNRKPARAFAPNVNKANKKWAVTTPPRKFAIKAVENDEEFGLAGARVFRVA